MFFIIGCNGNNDTDDDIKIYTGFEGLELNFIEKRPPGILETNSNSDLVLEIKNLGVFPRREKEEALIGKIYFDGFNEKIININPGEKQIKSELYGKTKIRTEGNIYRESFKIQTSEMKSEIQNIVAHACYQYKTIATPTICIKGINSPEEDEICNDELQTFQGGQGAPVAVMRVEQETGKDYIYFEIYVENKGEGVVFLENAIDSCPNSLKEYKNANMLEIKTDISGLEWGGCTPEIIRLDEERGSTVCKFKRLDSDSSYPAQLEINLKYGYYDFEKKEIKIVKR